MTDLDDRFEALSRAHPPELWRDIEGREPRPFPSSPTRRRATAIVVALAVAVAGLGVAALTFGGSEHPKRTAAAVTDGRIAFAGLGETTWNIYTIEPDGRHLTMLTNLTDQVADDPAWSSDGQRIAYVVRESNGASDIWVINGDGSGAYALTSGPGSSWGPTWSPDGSRLAYIRSAPGQADQIWIVGADGSNPRAFTYCDPPECVQDGSPAWSPDGSRLAFVRVSGAGAIIPVSVFVWPLEDSGPKSEAIELDGATWASDLAWSPDSSTLAFARSTSAGASSGLWQVGADGSDLVPLRDLPSAQSPSWSPDGRQIVFMAPIGPERETLFVMNADGTGVRRIDGLPENAIFPSWQPIVSTDRPPPAPGFLGNGPIYFRVGGGEGGSRIEAVEPDGSGRYVVFLEGNDVHHERISFSPDGTRIAFDNYLVDGYGIETANPDGTDVARLTDGVNDSWASWSPDGTKILFSSTRYDPSIEGCEPGFPHEYRCPTDIYLMDADGSNVVRLTDDPAGEFMPRWSPDGRLIAFVREGDPGAGTYEAIYTMRPDGTDVSQVSSGDRGSDFWPSWSPDGSQMVFAAIRAEDWGIWSVDADGANENLILGGTGAGYVDNPVWSPDGSLIAFLGNLTVDDYSPDDALYVMHPDGSGVTPIADAPGIGVAGDIAWQPIPATGSDVPTPSMPPPSAEVVDTFSVGSDVRSVAYGEASVWVAVADPGGSSSGRIVRIDPATHDVQAEIPVGAVPIWEVGGGAMVFADGDLWVAGALEKLGGADSPGGGADAAVVRIDPSTNEVVQEYAMGGTGAADFTFLDGDLWVLVFGDETVDHRMEVVEVDPSTGDVLTRVALPATWAHSLVAADGRLVTAVGGDGAVNVDGRVIQIDPETGAVAPVEIPSRFFTPMPVLWRGQVWISTDPGYIRFDSLAQAFLEPLVALAPRFGDCCGFIEADDRGIWFLSLAPNGTDRQLDLFDPATGEATELVELDEGGPVAMAVAPDAVWILNYEGTLTHVDLD
jgi:Tol biopolymer transport system component